MRSTCRGATGCPPPPKQWHATVSSLRSAPTSTAVNAASSTAARANPAVTVEGTARAPTTAASAPTTSTATGLVRPRRAGASRAIATLKPVKAAVPRTLPTTEQKKTRPRKIRPVSITWFTGLSPSIDRNT